MDDISSASGDVCNHIISLHWIAALGKGVHYVGVLSHHQCSCSFWSCVGHCSVDELCGIGHLAFFLYALYNRLLFRSLYLRNVVQLVFVEPGLNLLFCAGGLGIFHPLLVWMGGRGGHDLHDLSVLQRLVERNDGSVGPGAGTVVSDFCMDLVCKVQGCGAYRKLYYMALGSEYHNGVLQQFILDLLHVVFALLDFLGPVLYLLYNLLVVQGIQALPCSAFASRGSFVGPVGGYTFLSCLVHFPGSDLDFQML